MKKIKQESYSVYVVEASNCDYDEYDELTIIATDEESAKKQSAYYCARSVFVVVMRPRPKF